MEKILDYPSETSQHKFLHTVRTNGGALVKTASANNAAWPPEVSEFISKLQPKPGYHYSLCNALGAGEYWSSNVNGDFFERDELMQHHPSFLNGNPFMHHVNKDPA